MGMQVANGLSESIWQDSDLNQGFRVLSRSSQSHSRQSRSIPALPVSSCCFFRTLVLFLDANVEDLVLPFSRSPGFGEFCSLGRLGEECCVKKNLALKFELGPQRIVCQQARAFRSSLAWRHSTCV